MKKLVVFLFTILSLIMTPSMAFAFSEVVVEPHVSISIEEPHVVAPAPVESEENVHTTPVVPVVPHTATTQPSATNQSAAVQGSGKKENTKIKYILFGIVLILSIALIIAVLVSI